MNPPPWTEGNGLAQKWWEFHCTHPEVGALLCSLAQKLRERGHDRISVKMIWETARYMTRLGASPTEDIYRLNNNHHAYYARWLMETYPELEGAFEIRRTQETDMTLATQ